MSRTVLLQHFKSRAHLVSAIVDRDGPLCYLCSNGFSSTDRPTLDHVKPLSKGGLWDFDNLKLAHRRCNVKKGDREFNDDGVLELPLNKITYRERKVNKQKILDNFCEECFDGRKLQPDEECWLCARKAVQFPWTTKLDPKECSHSGPWWCWLCSIGIADRVPAIVHVLDGEDGAVE